MATTFSPMPDLENVAELLKEKLPELAHIIPSRIVYLSFSKKVSDIKGKIGPIPARFLPFFPDKDYFLEIHKESWNAFNEGERLYVMLHELLHIPEEGFQNSSKNFRKIEKHTIEDFSVLLTQYGVNMERVSELERKVKV